MAFCDNVHLKYKVKGLTSEEVYKINGGRPIGEALSHMFKTMGSFYRGATDLGREYAR